MGDDSLTKKREEFLQALKAAGGNPGVYTTKPKASAERGFLQRSRQDESTTLRATVASPAMPGASPSRENDFKDDDELDRWIQQAAMGSTAPPTVKSLRFTLPSPQQKSSTVPTRRAAPPPPPSRPSLLPMMPDGPPKVDLHKVAMDRSLPGLAAPMGSQRLLAPISSTSMVKERIRSSEDSSLRVSQSRPKFAASQGTSGPSERLSLRPKKEETQLSALAMALLEDPHAAERLAENIGVDTSVLASNAMQSAAVSRSHPLFAGYLSQPLETDTRRESLAQASATLGHADDINQRWLKEFRSKQAPLSTERMEFQASGCQGVHA